MNRRDHDDTDGGFALFVVLAFLLLAAAIATPFFTMSRHYAFISRNVADDVKEHALSQAILAVFSQRYLEVASRSGEPPTLIRCQTGGRYPALSASLQSHTGLVDLNAAPPELLQLGFRALGLDTPTATGLARTAEAYRTINPEGTVARADPEVVGGLKQGPFVSVAELLDFQVLQTLRPEDLGRVFTVHSNGKALNGDLAAPALKAILMKEPSAGIAAASTESDTVAPFTIELELATPRGGVLRTSAVYLPDKDKGIVRRAGRVSTLSAAGARMADEGQDVGETSEPLECADFFDQGSLALLSELVR